MHRSHIAREMAGLAVLHAQTMRMALATPRDDRTDSGIQSMLHDAAINDHGNGQSGDENRNTNNDNADDSKGAGDISDSTNECPGNTSAHKSTDDGSAPAVSAMF